MNADSHRVVDCHNLIAEPHVNKIWLGAIDKLFLTHLHSDHILSTPDLLLVGWMEGRKTPLRVGGPAGSKNMMDSMGKAFEFDIQARADFDDRRNQCPNRS